MIAATSRIDLPTMREGRKWHQRTRHPLFPLLPLLGLLLLVAGLWLPSAGYRGNALPYGLGAFGVWLILRSFVYDWWFRNLVKKMPMLGEEVTWSFEEASFSMQVRSNTSKSELSSLYRATATPRGILLYPQKNLYYWLPAAGFATAEDYETVAAWIAAAPRFSRASGRHDSTSGR